MGDNNYPTQEQRQRWENFVDKVYEAHPKDPAKFIAQWEAARDAWSFGSGTREAFDEATKQALTPDSEGGGKVKAK